MDTASPTLWEILETTGAEVSVYDLGRRIGRLERGDFLAFERAVAPYPSPMQRKAWFGLVQRRPDAADDPLVWFLRLGLDERGLLLQAQRDYLLERLARSAQAGDAAGAPDFLQDNPFAFTPRDDRMAVFHARLSADLGLPPSRFYDHALDYFRGKAGWEGWAFVGYQGIADLACRHGDEPLTAAIPRLPKEPLVALAHCLESGRPDDALLDALVGRLDQALAHQTPDVALAAALIRSLASRATGDRVRRVLSRVLAHPIGRQIEILAAISGRGWTALQDPGLLLGFLENLAENDHGQAAFEQCLDDLLSVPAMTDRVRTALRAPDRSPAVRDAFVRMTERAAPNDAGQ